MKVERNGPCPCGANKKYKHCYGKEGSSCTLFIRDQKMLKINEHEKREKEVLSFFKEIMAEAEVVNLKDPNGNDLISSRIQMLVVFSIVDVLASYWYEYSGQTGKTNERAQKWYDAFCAIERNKHYQNLWRDVSSSRLYIFRNALVHFFGLGEQNEEISILLGQNNLPEKTREMLHAELLAKNHKTIVVRPKDFFDMVAEGAIIMLSDWGNTIKEAQRSREREKEYIAGIERVWKKVKKEGAVRVD